MDDFNVFCCFESGVFLQKKGFPGEIEFMIFYDLEQTDGLNFNFRFSKSLFHFIYGPW